MASQGKLVIIGIDSISMSFLDEIIKRGYCPTLKFLIENGCYAQGRSFCPVETGTNWAVISTGASPMITGCNMALHLPGTPLNQTVRGFPSHLCLAEQIWNTARRAGRRSVIFDYPQSRPINCDDVIHVGGDGAPGQSPYALTEMHAYKTDPPPDSSRAGLANLVTQVEPRPARNWKNLPEMTPPPLELELPVKPWAMNGYDRASSLHALITGGNGGGYDTVAFFSRRDFNTKLGEARRGEWSDWLVNDFETDKGIVRAATRAKIFKLSGDGKDVHIYLHQIFPVSGFAHPGGIERKLLERCGYYYPNTCRQQTIISGAADIWTFLEEVRHTVQWYCKAMECILGEEDWHLFIQKWHPPDFANHFAAFMVDPRHPLFDPEREQEGWDYWGEVMRHGDMLIEKAMQLAGEDAIIAVVSDHGGKTAIPGEAENPNLQKPLIEAGLLVKRDDGSIDWSRTRAFPRHHYIYVNLKGRDPQGIVEAGEEYEEVRQLAIEAVLGAKDPRTGKPLVNLACRREDAEILGVGGERVGDVFVWWEMPREEKGMTREEFERLHPDIDLGTWEQPRQNSGKHSPDPFIIMYGAPFRKGYRRERAVWLNYFAPTLCHAWGIPAPRDADGGVIWDFLG